MSASDPFDRSQDVAHGVAETFEPGIRRVVCPNPGPMTFTGTNSWILGTGRVAILDPGPDIPEHRAALLAALGPGEEVEAILVTHSHVDHSPGARPLAEETGAPIIAFGPHGAGISPRMAALAESGAEFGGGEGSDRDFQPDIALCDGEVYAGTGWTVRAIHTPGHLSNHLCFAVERLEGGRPGAVFSGDHVMAWATTMVSPPDGDMAAFMASLRKMRTRADQDRVYYPGHGAPVQDPAGMIDHQLAHREARAAQVAEALGKMGPATPAELTAVIYADIDKALHAPAARNVFSALLGMLEEGTATHDGPLSPDAAFRLA
ncbi:MBL fold metallo-hydrolase [Rhodovulum sp. DZ06]|uniref:MBL fold metallo-hydrolase n=1 Tax=Rhodovulum sp. DZ06 TaxID=3425126 RepID=UPI003D32DC49